MVYNDSSFPYKAQVLKGQHFRVASSFTSHHTGELARCLVCCAVGVGRCACMPSPRGPPASPVSMLSTSQLAPPACCCVLLLFPYLTCALCGGPAGTSVSRMVPRRLSVLRCPFSRTCLPPPHRSCPGLYPHHFARESIHGLPVTLHRHVCPPRPLPSQSHNNERGHLDSPGPGRCPGRQCLLGALLPGECGFLPDLRSLLCAVRAREGVRGCAWFSTPRPVCPPSRVV